MRSLLPLALLPALAFAQAEAGQLRDYSLPSETRAAPPPLLLNTPPVMQAPNVQQMPPPPASGAEWNKVMADFRNQALALDLPQRRALADSLREKIKKAVDDGRMDKAKYYMGLLKEVESLIPAPAGGPQ